jgi:hypothetical protein
MIHLLILAVVALGLLNGREVSFGKVCQAIEIARTCFGRFFQMRLEIVG